jgi:hypothetical protein
MPESYLRHPNYETDADFVDREGEWGPAPMGGHAFGWGDAMSRDDARLLRDMAAEGAITIHDESIKRYIEGAMNSGNTEHT